MMQSIRKNTMALGLLGLISLSGAYAAPSNSVSVGQTTEVSVQGPKIQLAILLDTSSSMDGLIDQARNQLWQAVNAFAKTTKDGETPVLEVAVYEYGNSRLSSREGYVRQVTGLTAELDRVSEALFALTTSGGDEYCGQVIQSALNELAWSPSTDDLKAIFIAGNEPFTQGPVPYQEVISQAKSKGVVVNTIHAGGYQEGARSGWRDGALLAGGSYMNIDQNQKIAHIAAPQDRRIAQLNTQLNETYLPYGQKGKASLERQQVQDAKSEGISSGLLAQRAQSKASALYNNAGWDLVDAVESAAVDPGQLEAKQLPEEMREMDAEERQAYVAEKAQERAQIRKEIADLSKAREAYVAEQRRADAGSGEKTLNDALVTAARRQGETKGFQYQAAQ